MLAFMVAFSRIVWLKEVGIATFALFVAFDVIDVERASPSLIKAGRRLTKSKPFLIRTAASLTGILGRLYDSP